jgi:hypothetical protein
MEAPSIATSPERPTGVQGKPSLMGSAGYTGKAVSDIVRQTGFDRRTIAKWIRLDAIVTLRR